MSNGNPIVVRATIKGLGKDENGIQQYVWLTQQQADELSERQYDTELCRRLVKYGDRRFKPIDVESMEDLPLTEEMIKYSANFRGYVLEALMEEGQLPNNLQKVALESGYRQLITKAKQNLPMGQEPKLIENPEGLKRLAELKSQHRLEKGLE